MKLEKIAQGFRFVGATLFHFWVGGTRDLLEYEKKIYEAILNAIDDEEARAAYREQLQNVRRVSRYVHDRIVIFSFKRKYDRLRTAPRGVVLIPETYGGGDFLATVKIRQGRRRNEAVVVLVNGYLHGLQFQKSPLHLRERPFEIESVQIGGAMIDYAREIDREEHGDLP